MSHPYLFPGVSTGFFVLLFAASLAAPAAAAERNPEIERLQQQVLDLQRRVERLEGELAEGVPVNMAREVEPVPGGWRKGHNWRLLREGMTAYRVKEVLGEPDRERSVKKFEFWYYGDAKVSLYMRRLKRWETPDGLDGE